MKHSFPAAVLLAAAAFAAFVAGCESGDSYSISVSPNYAKIRPGQSVTLTAGGWENYSWSLDSENGAHLSATTGKSVVFYADGGASNAVYNVTAAAIGSGAATNSAGYTAKAKIAVE
jgi:hypothetical protein